jgi:hypothetical protein
LKNTPIPCGRTQIVYSIPFYLGICAALEILFQKWKKSIVLSITIFVFLIWHFISAFTLLNTIEWWQNGDAKIVCAYFIEKLKNTDTLHPITIGAEKWQYHSLAFYINTQLAPKAIIEYAVVIDHKDYDYLVSPIWEHEKVGKQYQLIQQLNRCNIYKLKTP